MRLFIVHHTHWDREWFLTSDYTSEWLVLLFKRLISLCGRNPSFKFVLDGQTLILEDLKKVDEKLFEKVKPLISSGNLLIGPYYCQLDWRISDGESLLRNIAIGLDEGDSFGGVMRVGWLLDNFGHPSQSPQIHSLFGVRDLFIWRGPYKLTSEFAWASSDGSEVLVVFLYGGYRSLFGLGKTPELTRERILGEIKKMKYQLTENLVLLDGYDLDLEPEDASNFVCGQLDSIELFFGSPSDYLSRVKRDLGFSLPRLEGELISGKYACTFPGTLSARTYLKLESADLEELLYRMVEPLLALNGKETRKEFWKDILRELVHDNICGVSVDQVHERSEQANFSLFNKLRRLLREEIKVLLRDAQEGFYAVNFTPYDYDLWYPLPSGEYKVKTNGLGFFKIDGVKPFKRRRKKATAFKWRNPYYEAEIGEDGTVRVNGFSLGYFTLEDELGDAYSHASGEVFSSTKGANLKPILVGLGDHHAKVAYRALLEGREKRASLSVRIIFDKTPLIRWEVDLDSWGGDLRVRMGFDLPEKGELFAGSQFDLVARKAVDCDLLPENLPEDLSSILIAARETGNVSCFPFQDVIALYDGYRTWAFLAKGLREYEWSEGKRLFLTLRRSVEWIAKEQVPGRVGDAGPKMYVPGARCERRVKHFIGFLLLKGAPWSDELFKWVSFFKTPPLIVHKKGEGKLRERTFLRFLLPLTALYKLEGITVARSFNPSFKPRWVEIGGESLMVRPKKIFSFEVLIPPANSSKPADTDVKILNPPKWRVGKSRSVPNPRILALIKREIQDLEMKVKELELEKGRYFTLRRKLLELKLSLALNEKASSKVIEDIGLELNKIRAQKRIYDYILALQKHNI